MSALALALRGVHQRFGSTVALADVTLEVRRGTIHAVLGENGAGKSTLMRVAYGMLHPEAGTVEVDAQPVTLRSSRDARTMGLGMVHQHFSLVPAMTVAENVALGGSGAFRMADAAARVQAAAGASGLPIDPYARVNSLGVGAQQRVELLKALAGNARTLILDEPTAVLTPAESDELYGWVRRFVADGHTVILITHKLNEALALADEVTVLRRGRVALAAAASTLTTTALVQAMTGDTTDVPATARRSTSTSTADPRVSLRAVDVRDRAGVERLRDVTLALMPGDVVGVAGVEGSGVQELLRVLAGRLTPSTGTITLPPAIGFIPEDRLRDALIGDFSLIENLALHEAGSRQGLMDWTGLTQKTARVLTAHDVRTTGPDALARDLSGGNQQKFVVGRELDGAPSLVIAENPIRGLDVRAAAHVMHALTTHAATGGTVVVFSTDIDDVLPVAERMLVTFDGRVREVPATRDAVAHALVGA